MTTTQHPAQVAQRDPFPHSDAIIDRMMGLRDQYVPHALNGHAKRSPSILAAQAAQIRKDMNSGKSAEVRRLLLVLGDLAVSGVPVSALESVIDEMRAYVALCAGDVAHEAKDLAVLVKQETRAQGRLDLAQLAVLDRPADALVVEECVQAVAEYETRATAFKRNLHARLAFLRGHTKVSTMQVTR